MGSLWQFMRKWSCPTRAYQGLGVLQRRMWSWQAARVWTSWRILEVRLYRSHVATAAATSSIRTWVAFAPSTACGGIVGSWRAFGRQLLGPLLVVHGCPHVNNCRVRRPSLPCRFEGLVLDRAQLALRDPGRSRDRASRHAGGHPALVVLKLHLESTDFNGFQVISDVTVVSLLRPLYTQPMLESFSFTPTLKSFEWQCEPKLVLARTLATSSHHLPFDCRVSYLSSHLIFFDHCILLELSWPTELQKGCSSLN